MPVDHAKNGPSKNGQIRCVWMNFDTPTSPLHVSIDVIATIVFCSLGHCSTDPSFRSNAPSYGQFGRQGINLRSDVGCWHKANVCVISRLMSASDPKQTFAPNHTIHPIDRAR